MKLTSEIFLTSCFFSIENSRLSNISLNKKWLGQQRSQIRSSGTILSKKGKVYPVDWWVCFDVKQAPVAQCLTTGQGVKVNCSWQASFRYRVLLSPRRWHCRLVRCWLEELEKLNNLPIWPIFSSDTYNTFYIGLKTSLKSILKIFSWPCSWGLRLGCSLWAVRLRWFFDLIGY